LSRLGFLDMLAPNSIKMYRTHYKTYFRLIYKIDPEKEITSEELAALADRYFTTKRDYQKDIESFFVSMKGRPPLSIRTMLAVVKALLVANDIELKSKFWKDLNRRKKGNRAATIDRLPSHSELRTILMGMSIQGRAFFIVAATSGMRVGEMLQLKLTDIDLAHDPAKITIRREYTKNGNPRIAFISSEAKDVLERWLPQRRAYMEKSSAKTQKAFGRGKDMGDERLFPLSSHVIHDIFNNALKAAGLYEQDPSTGRATIHPHCLRSFFRTHIGRMNVDMTEVLIGHEGYLTREYRKYQTDQETLAKFYRENETILAILADPKVISKAVEENQKGIQATLGGIAIENARLKEQLARLEERQNRIDAHFERERRRTQETTMPEPDYEDMQSAMAKGNGPE
jgi:integrase